MAEIAIPAVVMGALYLMNSDKSKTSSKENFDDVSAPTQRKLVEGSSITYKPMTPPVNYPKQTYSELTKNTKHYPAPNAATDRYYQHEVYEKKVKDGKDPTNSVIFQSMSGDNMQKCDMKHNNMVPFFGSSVKQRTTKYNGNESILDNMLGSGSQRFHKKEQAPLFAPKDNMNWSHGMPSTSDFMQSRMNPSRNIANEKPWEEIRVGPGLDKGFSSEGSNGFNAGVEARKKWLPYTVDKLRTKTNPKVTFGLANHEGPAQGSFTRGIEGRVEKNRPDTFYTNTPDRWFTTTGQEKKQTVRSAQMLQPVNRAFTTKEYFGASTANQNGGGLAGRSEQQYRKSTRPVLSSFDKYVGGAHNMSYRAGGDGSADDYGKDGYRTYHNARSTTRQADEFGGASGWFKAITAPILDVLRPSRKENFIGNARPNGNAKGAYGVSNARVWNPADRPKTTIKEQTIDNIRPEGNVGGTYGVNDGGYLATEYQPIENQRDSTNREYTGNSSAASWTTAPQSYTAAYNAELNPNKEELVYGAARENMGNMSLTSHAQNIAVGKIGSVQPDQLVPNMPKSTTSLCSYGTLSNSMMRGQQSQDCQRNNSAILDSFKKNPYTQSLSSVA